MLACRHLASSRLLTYSAETDEPTASRHLENNFFPPLTFHPANLFLSSYTTILVMKLACVAFQVLTCHAIAAPPQIPTRCDPVVLPSCDIQDHFDLLIDLAIEYFDKGFGVCRSSE